MFSGGSVAFIIGFIAMPIISRIYPPEEFGRYQLMLSIVTSASVIASLRLNMALVLEKEEEDRNSLTLLVLLITLFTTIIFFLTFLLFGDLIFEVLNATELKPYIFVMSIMFLLYGIYDTTSLLYIANGKFGKLAINNVIYQSTFSSLQIGGGLVFNNFIILFISQLISYFLTFLYAIKNFKLTFNLTYDKSIQLLKKHKNFIFYETPSKLVTLSSGVLPIIFLVKYHGSESAAYYSMALNIFNAPIGVVLASFENVFYKNASDLYNRDNEQLYLLFKNTFKKLFLITLLPHIFVFFLAEHIVLIFLGENWFDTIWILKSYVILSFLILLSRNFISIFSILNKQNYYLYINILILLVSFISLFFFRFEYVDMINTYLYSLSITYLLIIYLSFRQFYKIIKK